MSFLHNLSALNFLAVGLGAALGAWVRWLLGLALKPALSPMVTPELYLGILFLCALPATDLALKHVGRPVPNVPLLAGFAAMSGLIQLETIRLAIETKFSGKVAQGNFAAATEAFEMVRALIGGACKESVNA